MSRINSNLKYFFNSGYNQKRCNYLYHKYSQEYIRKRLRFLEELRKSRNMMATLRKFNISWKAGQKQLTDFKEEGLDKVCTPISRKVKQRLSLKNKQKLKEIILTKSPQDYKIDRYIWTAKILEAVIKQKFGVELKDSRIYEILSELNLSDQKAHRDYDNADSQKQKEFQIELKRKLKKSKNQKLVDTR